MCNRTCKDGGYKSGFYIGEGGGGARQCACIK